MPSSALPRQPHLALAERQRTSRRHSFGHYPGSNAIVPCCTTVDPKGHLLRKSIRAALRSLRQLKPSLVPGMSTSPKPEYTNPSGLPSQQQSSSSSALHVIHRGRVQKQPREDHSARGVPLKRGGGGGRGQHWNNNTRRGHGNRRN